MFCVLTIVAITTKLNSQTSTFLNRVYQDGSGSPSFNPILNPIGLQWSKSITCANGDLMTVGHTYAIATGEDIYVIRRDSEGNVVFEQNYDVANASYNDYGTDIYETTNNDFIVCGMTDNGTTTNYDVAVLRINSAGTLLNSNTKDGPSNKNDFAVSIIEGGSGYIFVGANTENSFFDYWLIKWDSGLNFNSENFYDYTGLSDVAIGMEVDAVGSEVRLIGASASGTNSCDYAIARFDGTTMSYLSDGRSSLPGVALDKALAYCRDAGNNTYITGQAWNGTNFDIKTVKILANMTVAWTVTMNVHSYDDAGTTIALDPTNGHVIVGGYATRSGNIKDMICVRHNASTGATLAVNYQQSENNSGDAFIKKVCAKTNGDIYFVGGEKGNSGYKQVSVGKIDVAGNLCWQRKIMDSNLDILPSDIQSSGNTVDLISVVDSTINSYLTTEYSELAMDTAAVYNNSGVPYWKKNEVIVKFLPSALDSAAIDNTIGTAITQFGSLSYFMKPAAYSALTFALTDACPRCDLKAVKIFPELPTTFTSTSSRLEETVPISDFWATLLVVIPSNLDMQQFCNALSGIAAYAHPNYIGQTSPNPTVSSFPTSTVTGFDPYYLPLGYSIWGQLSLNDSANHNVDINAVEAWQIYPEGGIPSIKCGVFDQGLDWSHEDFGYNGVNPASSKVKGCRDFRGGGLDLKTVPFGGDSTGHGTSCAGIIGAIRNNTLGIKGIAGGNDTLNNNPGISLYGLKIGGNAKPYAYGLANLQADYLAHAIVTSAMNNLPGIAYDYGLDLSNNSWIFPVPQLGPPLGPPNLNSDTNIVLIGEAIHHINRLNVTFVGATGNDGLPLTLPTNFDDDWVLAVSGTGDDGNFTELNNSQFYSNCGKGVDIAAPSSPYRIVTTGMPNSYQAGSGTSAACPHVTGVAGLLMSYNNNPLNPYQNLAPEDVEQLIQRSASPMPNGTPLPNDSVGYGRLNAGKALSLIEKPCHKLWHFGTKYTSKTINKLQAGGPDTIVFTERFHDLNSPANYLPKGKYIVQAYEINAFVNHSLSSSDTIKAYWPRPSMSEVWDRVRNKKLRPHEKDTILSCSNSQAHLRGYIYKVSDTLGNVKGWWPFDTSLVVPATASLFEYSILTSSCSLHTGIKKENIDIASVNLFPNPSQNSQTLEIQTDKVSNLTVDLYDMMGRYVKRVYSGKTNGGKTTINNDVSNLAHSLYIYIIKIDTEVVIRKFIKE